MHIYVVCEKIIFSDTFVSQSFYQSVCSRGRGWGPFETFPKNNVPKYLSRETSYYQTLYLQGEVTS